jgi:hypothetical protein
LLVSFAWDAVKKVLPLILEQAAEFYSGQVEFGPHHMLQIASMFVREEIDTEVFAQLIVYPARDALQHYHGTPETRAQLERIANSREADQPSQPTEPTTTDLEPRRSARRGGEQLRSSGNGGQAEASQ